MELLQAVSVVSFVGLAVWRLSRTVLSVFNDGGEILAFGRDDSLNLRGLGIIDFLYLVGIWMSAQTALWVVCGFAGVLLNWLALAGLSRLMSCSKTTADGGLLAGVSASQKNATASEACHGAPQLCL